MVHVNAEIEKQMVGYKWPDEHFGKRIKR
jgi:hypothetical protein